MSGFRYSSIFLVVILLFHLVPGKLSAQDYKPGRTVIVNGGTATTSARNEYSTTIVVGEPFVTSTKGLNFASSTGMWGVQLNSPSSPDIQASEGDFPDRVILSWQLEVLSPAPNKGYHIYRDGVLLARVSRNDTSYTDKNVKPGNFYFYTLTAINNFGESVVGSTTGFVNPNGVITGTVTTSKNRPVSSVEVSLSPVVGRSLNFDGADDQVTLEEIQSIATTLDSEVTFSVWVNPSATGTDRMIGGAQADNSGNISYPFTISTSGDKFSATVTTQNGSSTITGTTTHTTSQWYHLTITYNSVNGANLFINGSLEASDSLLTGSLSTLTDFVLGEDLEPASLANWAGLMDEVRLWNVERDSSQIQTDKDRTISGKSDGLLGYWRMDEGTGDLIFDLTDNKMKGEIDGAAFSSTHADLPASALTDSLGNYQIEGIFYGTSTTFDVIPTKAFHSFTPALRNATLSTSNTGVNNVDFSDDSQIAVEGFVKFAGYECFENSVEILVDGESTIPKTYTDGNGEYVVEFEPGTSAAISPSLHNHAFSPITHTVENITEPIAGIEFSDNELVDLTVQLAGGYCEYPIGKATVTVRTEDGCFNKKVSTNNAGTITLRNLPANKYEVILEPENPNIAFDGQQVNLKAGSDTVKFIYHAPLEAEIELLSTSRKVNGIPVLKMAAEGQDTTHFRFNLFEKYGNNVCYIDTGKVKVIDKISLKELTSNLSFRNPDITSRDSMPVFSLIVGRPNFIDGGEHPYQKELQIETEDANGRKSTAEFWAYVEGHQTTGNSFITTAPNRPMFVLRDPPGDLSYSEITKNYTVSQTSSYSVQKTGSAEYEEVVMGGVDEEEGEGITIETIDEDLEKNVTAVSRSYRGTFGTVRNFSFSKVIRTDNTPRSVKGLYNSSDYDIIAGAAENFLYGVVQSLKVLPDGTVDISKKLGIEPKGFQTFYYYTKGYIKDVLMSEIAQSDLSDEEKQQALHEWQQHLDYHNRLTSLEDLLNLPQALAALHFKKNVSFSSGAAYDETVTFQSISDFTYDFQLSIEKDVSDELNIRLGGEGTKATATVKNTLQTDKSFGVGYTGSSSTHIHLDDQTDGDAFTVEMKTDVLGFPLYTVKAGRSTNPREDRTSRRDKLSLTLDSYDAVNVPLSGEAEFTLNLGNESETSEDRVYQVRLIPESNPGGAIIKLGGKPLPSTNVFTVPSGESIQAELTVEKGPEAFEYESLKLMAYAPGQYDLWLETQDPWYLDAVDTVAFSVQFSEACGSDVEIANFNNFVINKYNTTAYPVQVFGYNPNDPDFDQLLLEYQHSGEDFWIIADSVRADSIGVQDFYYMNWAFQNLADGDFNLRAKAVCLDGTVSESNHISGVVDRSSPGLFGEPSPVNNGVLGFGQDISLTFNEQIDTTTLFVDQIRLFNTEEDREIPMRYSSDGTSVILTPEEQNRFIEGVRLRAEIDTLADMHGNWISEPITWEFEVDRNPIRWNQPALTEAVYTSQNTEFQIPLNNLSLQTTEFTVTDIPDWMSVSPVEGNIGANGKIDVNITVRDDINFGEYYDTLNVKTTEGNEPLKLNIRALEQPPVWSVDPQQYEHQMDMIGRVELKGEISDDPYDIVGVFVNGQCRGFASPELVEEAGEYLLFLNIYSNQQSGEELTFRLWDAEDAEEYWELSDNYTFSSNTLTGSISDPVTFSSEGDVAQHITLNKGWTWITEHLLSSADNQLINLALDGVPFSEGDRIISYDRFESWSVSAQKWIPGKLRFSPMNSYHMHADSAVTITFIGQEIDPSELAFTLVPGNNWIGYPLRRNTEINNALSELEAAEGSVMRSQTEFAEYVGGEINRWVGNLNILRSGNGYILTSTSQDTLTFNYNNEGNLSKQKGKLNQSFAGLSDLIENGKIQITKNVKQNPEPVAHPPETEGKPLSSSMVNKNQTLDDLVWELNIFESEYNMPAVVQLDGEMSQDTSWFIGAFIDNELSGIGKVSYTEELKKHQAFMMIYHHAPEAETVTFSLYNLDTEQMLRTEASADFNYSHILGSVGDPFKIKPITKADLPKEFALSQNYPNPFNPSTTFNFSLPQTAKVSIVIYNLLGQKVAVLIDDRLRAGVHTVKWDAGKAGIASGMYLAVMKASDFRQIRKLMLIK